MKTLVKATAATAAIWFFAQIIAWLYGGKSAAAQAALVVGAMSPSIVFLIHGFFIATSDK